MTQDALEVPHAMWLPQQPGRERERENAPTLPGSLGMQQIRSITDLIGPRLFGVQVINKNEGIADLGGQRHGP